MHGVLASLQATWTTSVISAPSNKGLTPKTFVYGTDTAGKPLQHYYQACAVVAATR